jgi:hypothetical protein
METLIINVPEDKSALIKEILVQFGVTFKQGSDSKKPSEFAGSISKEEAQKIIQAVDKSRQEWERSI